MTKKMNQEEIKTTSLIWSLPILFSLLGGILMYIAVKDKDQKMANDAIFLGLMLQIGFAILGIVGFIMFYSSIAKIF